MKTTALFQLGGIAVLLSTILFGIGDLLYFLSGEQPQTSLGLWVGILGSGFRVLGMGALFARQAQRGGILGLIGYVLLVWGSMIAVGYQAVALGVQAGVVSNEQVAQVPSYALGSTLLFWSLYVGEVVFGISIYRAQVFPKYAGALFVLVGILHYLTGPLAITRPIYAISSLLAYAWPGWILLMDKRVVSFELAPAT